MSPEPNSITEYKQAWGNPTEDPYNTEILVLGCDMCFVIQENELT